MSAEEILAGNEQAAPGRRGLRAWSGVRELVLLPVIAVIVAIGSQIHPAFLTSYNLLFNVLGASSVLMILVVAESLLIIAGKFDLSLQSTVALAPMIGVVLVVPAHAGGWGTEINQYLGLAALFGVGLIVGAFNGLLVTKLRLNAFIVTLAMLILLQGLTMGAGSGRTITKLPPAFQYIGNTMPLGIPMEVWIAAIVAIGAMLFVRFHTVGREIYAIGGNAEAARAAGVKVNRVTLGLFVLASLLASLAGLILTSRIASVSANQGADMIFTVFAASVIGGIDLNGGKGRLIGAITGVCLIAVIQNLLVLSEVPSFWVTAIYGAVIMASMMLAASAGSFRQILQAVGNARPDGSKPLS
ncbi:MAG: ABC transporter permease [Mesorhizobium sp.]|nr:MAG: ABC transporter permease [Mesorhizobium sp.]RWL23501.1 MAG: ABC transporter permease [Mesorhizobium sp.]RWL25539.1 MAG: ABC transporter permease [Mesorhizobium sp.]RWL33688.1 MAG: ABC transporter permease [Mesorhizobium sp.]RWL47846.1 MAG: ABC transporter permease [Mesorhizobium sp.]